jgi:hypothetical protein
MRTGVDQKNVERANYDADMEHTVRQKSLSTANVGKSGLTDALFEEDPKG